MTSSSTTSSTSTTIRSAGAPTTTRSSSRAPGLVHPHDGAQDRAIANNRAIHWLPEHIKEGRFGDFLANNVDWALSRERYWGTPLNVWVCDADADHMEAPSSVAEIEKLNPASLRSLQAGAAADPTLSEHLIVHKPWIDAVDVPLRDLRRDDARVPEVIDCWFDSGCMPFAQWGYPHPGQGAVRAELPRRLHQRGDRSDARLVLLAAHDLDARLRRGRQKPRLARTPSRRASCSGTSATRKGRRSRSRRGTTRRPRSSSTT